MAACAGVSQVADQPSPESAPQTPWAVYEVDVASDLNRVRVSATFHGTAPQRLQLGLSEAVPGVSDVLPEPGGDPLPLEDGTWDASALSPGDTVVYEVNLAKVIGPVHGTGSGDNGGSSGNGGTGDEEK